MPVDKNVEGDDRRDDQERQETEYRRAAGDERLKGVEKPLCALGDKIADGALNLCARQLLVEAQGVQPAAAVFRNEGVALLHGEGLQAHRIVRQALGKGYELIAQDRGDENENNHHAQGESDQNEERRTEAVEPQTLELEHDRVEKVAQHDAAAKGVIVD